MRRLALALTALAALAACNKSNDNARSATGQVLEGTVSDEMLPVDTLTSEPPLAEPVDTKVKGGAAMGAAAKGATSDDSAVDSAAAPADSATAAPPAPAATSTPE